MKRYTDIDKYFKDRKSKYIFALIALSGKQRNKIIELTDDLYVDRNKAEKWYNSLMKLIRNDADAVRVLNSIYTNIISSIDIFDL